MWGMDLVCDLRARVSRRGGAGCESSSRLQIEFTMAHGWGILEIRKNEENAPRFQRSRKKVVGVCVFGGADLVVGAGLGFGVAGCGDGLLRWGDVSFAWACAQEEFERYQFGEGYADDRLPASRAEGGDGLHHGVLPSYGSGCDRGNCFSAAESSNRYRAAPYWSPGAHLALFSEFFCF
jgi:hypothetical protein